MRKVGSKNAVLIASLAAVGCVPLTINGFENRPPTLAADSQRSLNDISVCIVDDWQKTKQSISTLPRANGTALVLTPPTLMVVDIEEHGSSRHVVAHGPYMNSSKFNRTHVDQIRSCL